MAQLTKRIVDAAKPLPDKDFFVWCGALPGFGVRVYPSGRRIFVVQVRIGRRVQRRVKIGQFGPFTVEQARREAAEIIRKAAQGVDAQAEKREARHALTVEELCGLYLEAASHGLAGMTRGKPKAASTLYLDGQRINRHIVPLLGSAPAKSLTRAHVQRMLVDKITTGGTVAEGTRVAGGPMAATRTIQLFGGILAWGQRRGYLPDGVNPAHGLEVASSTPRDRTLADAELTRLGTAMRERPSAGADVLRLILLTGLRRTEAAGLRWSEVDEQGHCLRLVNTKTGKSDRPIGAAALDLLRSLPHDGERVFPAPFRASYVDIRNAVPAIIRAAGIDGATLHDCRRTFASVAANLGYSDGTIGELLGHAARGVTARHYIRRADPVLIAAADKVAERINAALNGQVGLVIAMADRGWGCIPGPTKMLVVPP